MCGTHPHDGAAAHELRLSVDMRNVLVRAVKNYDDHAVGDEFWAPMTEATAHLIVSHYLELRWDPSWELGYGTCRDVPIGTEGDGPG